MKIDYSDTQVALARHAVSGDEYIVQLCSVWDGDRCVGERITASAGPINRRDDLGITDGGPVEASTELFDLIERTDWNLDDENAEYLQAEDEAGRLTYPVGAR